MTEKHKKTPFEDLIAQMASCQSKMYNTSKRMASYAWKCTASHSDEFRVKLLASSAQLETGSEILRGWINGIELEGRRAMREMERRKQRDERRGQEA